MKDFFRFEKYGTKYVAIPTETAKGTRYFIYVLSYKTGIYRKYTATIEYEIGYTTTFDYVFDTIEEIKTEFDLPTNDNTPKRKKYTY